MIFIDQLGRQVILRDYPKRIVSLVPSQTELLFDLGLDVEVVGITKFCIHPQGWYRSKARVGGTKDVLIDKVASLHPDLIIANKEENTKDNIEELSKIAPVWISDVNAISDALSMIRALGELTGKGIKALEINSKIELLFASLDKKNSEGKKVHYYIWKEPDLLVGKNTFIDAMLNELGFENAVNLSRYPEYSSEMEQPELVFLSSEPYPFSEKHIAYFTDRYPSSRLYIVDGEAFSWYGSRMVKSLDYFKLLFDQVRAD